MKHITVFIIVLLIVSLLAGCSTDNISEVEQRAYYLSIFVIVLFTLLSVTVILLIKNIKLSKSLKELVNIDALTGIYNRRSFMELATSQMARSLRTNMDCFIIIFDLDKFKVVNDTHGHLAGDKVLRTIAQAVKSSIRPYDILGRYGGEEFIILMTDIEASENHENVFKATERLRQKINSTIVEYEGKEISVTASFGIAYAAPKNDLDTAILYADEALYRAKNQGRDMTAFYEQDEMK